MNDCLHKLWVMDLTIVGIWWWWQLTWQFHKILNKQVRVRSHSHTQRHWRCTPHTYLGTINAYRNSLWSIHGRTPHFECGFWCDVVCRLFWHSQRGVVWCSIWAVRCGVVWCGVLLESRCGVEGRCGQRSAQQLKFILCFLAGKWDFALLISLAAAVKVFSPFLFGMWRSCVFDLHWAMPCE